MEEAARIDQQLFRDTLSPLLLVEHTALIDITTPMEEGNGYNLMNLMMDLKYEDGEFVFISICFMH